MLLTGSLTFVWGQCALRHPEFMNGLGMGCRWLVVPPSKDLQCGSGVACDCL